MIKNSKMPDKMHFYRYVLKIVCILENKKIVKNE